MTRGGGGSAREINWGGEIYIFTTNFSLLNR